MLGKTHREFRDRYYEKFGEEFPTFEVPTGSPEEEIEAIDKCLSANEPAKVVFGISYSKDIHY